MQSKILMIKDPDSVNTWRDADDRNMFKASSDLAEDLGDVITVTVDQGDLLNP